MIQCLDATLETVCGNVFSSYSTKSSSESFSSACTTSTGYTGLHLLCPPISTFEETDGRTYNRKCQDQSQYEGIALL